MTAVAPVAATLILAGCGHSDGSASDRPDRARGDKVVVMAASSLSAVLTGVATHLSRPPESRDGRDDPTVAEPVTIVAVLAGSSALVAQLDEGADADILMTADTVTMQRAVENGSVRGQVEVIATNALVLAVAPGNPGHIGSIDDMARPDLLIGLCASGVPCGSLADRVLARAGIEPAADTRELNVRSLATKIALGELDGGLIYATDAADLGLEIVDATGVGQLTNSYEMASVDLNPSTPVRAVLAAFEPGGIGAAIMTEAGFGPP